MKRQVGNELRSEPILLQITGQLHREDRRDALVDVVQQLDLVPELIPEVLK